MARLREIGRFVALALGLTLLASGLGFAYLRCSVQPIEGELTVAGTTATVTIRFDRAGVPHIQAESVDDAIFGLGFVHARDRLWQMEQGRRLAQGRLSEIFGAQTLPADSFMRTLDLPGHAARALQRLDAETRSAYAAYARGVNAAMEAWRGPLPPEFLLLRHRPEPWTADDSAAWVKLMAWDLARRWQYDLLRLRLSRRLPPDRLVEFLPLAPGEAPVPPPGYLASGAGLDDLGAAAGTLLAMHPPQAVEAAGSNNWVVGGGRSATGKPLLANDPHLAFTAPAVWYVAHLDAPGFSAIGATIPGIPGIILGRNAHLAWGFTDTGPDVQDLYIEAVDADDPNRYRTPAGWDSFATRRETIRVRGGADVVLDARATRHGPVISDALAGVGQVLPRHQVLALAWTGFDPDDRTARAAVRLMRATDVADLRETLRDFHAPQQNVVYASTAGTIGWIAAGRVPLRRPDNDTAGLYPAPGWDERYDWSSEIPFDALPQAIDPPAGMVVTANNRVVGPGYPYAITREWALPYREERIRALLQARDRHDPETFGAIQLDVQSSMAADLLPPMLAIAPADQTARAALALLADWDRRMDRGAAPLIFTAYLREFMRALFADELGEDFALAFALRPTFLLAVLADEGGQGRWCDDVTTPRREDCAEILARALDAALADLARRYGEGPERWHWEAAHAARHDHQAFSRVAVLAPLFGLLAPSGGDPHTVNAGIYTPADELWPFASRHGPAYRAVYDLADLDNSRFMLSTGQSGNPLSARYRDLAGDWTAGVYRPLATHSLSGEGAGLVLRLAPRPAR